MTHYGVLASLLAVRSFVAACGKLLSEEQIHLPVRPHLAAAMLFSPAAAVAQAAPNPNPNVGSEAQRAVSEVPATIDAEDAGEKKVQLLVGRRLMVTARKGDAEEMAQLLKLKPDVNFRDTDGTTPLQAACQVGMDG